MDAKSLFIELMGDSPMIRVLDYLLTERELEIIRLIARELSTNQIADKLFISPATVETHRHNILKKLGVKNSIGIVMYAVNNKIV